MKTELKDTKTMRRQAIEGVVITSVGSVITKMLGLVATAFLLSQLIPYEYGLWRLLLSVLSFFGLVGIGSISGVLVADIARELGNGRKGIAHAILRRAFLYFVLMGVLAATVMALSAPAISRLSGIGVTQMLWILSLTLVAGGVRQTMQIAFQARLEPVRAQLIDFIGSITYLAALVLLVGISGLGILGLVIAYTASTIVPIVALFPSFLSMIRSAPSTEEGAKYSFKDAFWHRGRWAFAEDYILTAANSAWPWLAGYFLSIADVGILSIAVVLVGQIAALVPVQYVLRSLLPRLASGPQQMSDWLVRGIRYSVWAQFVTAFLALIAASFAFPLFFPRYAAALPMYLLLIPAIPLRAAGSVLTEWYYARKAQKGFFFVSVLPKIALLALPLALIWLGTAGFALWFFVDAALTFVASYWFVRAREPLTSGLLALIIPDRRDFSLLLMLIAGFRSRLFGSRSRSRT
jgi:O-antigen/teichoic acid export membrane protein